MFIIIQNHAYEMKNVETTNNTCTYKHTVEWGAVAKLLSVLIC